MGALVIFSVAISPGPKILRSLLIGCSFDWIPRTDISWLTLVEPVSLFRSSWVGSWWTSSVGLTVLYLGRWQSAAAFITMHRTGILEHACVITAHTHVTWEPFQVSARESGNRNTPGECKGYEGFWGLTFIRSFCPPFKPKSITYRNNFLKYKVLTEKLQV